MIAQTFTVIVRNLATNKIHAKVPAPTLERAHEICGEYRLQGFDALTRIRSAKAPKAAGPRTAKVSSAASYVDCPKCNEPICDPCGTGSFVWNTAETAQSGLHTCAACGTVVKLPKWIKTV